MAPTVTFESINHAGITVDVFGNVNVVTEIKYSDNELTGNIASFKYDGTLVNQTDIWKTAADVGFYCNTHAVDNSGDIIIPTMVQNPDQTVVHRFEDEVNLTADATKQDLAGSITVFNSAQVASDNTQYKFGSRSINFQDTNSLVWQDLNLVDDWTVVMWVRMDSTHTTNNPRMEMITAVDDAGGDVQYIIDGNSGSGNFGKVGLELNPAGAASSTIWSVGSTYWTAMSDSQWHHIALVKEEPTLGSYVYSCYFDGVQVATAITVNDIVMNDLTVGASQGGPLIY